MDEPQRHSLTYMAPDPPAAPARSRRGRSVFLWVVFVGIAIVLFLLMSKQGVPYKSISLDDFLARVEVEGVTSVVLNGDEITGRLSDGSQYRTALPAGLSADWNFVHWLIDKTRGTAHVQVQSERNGFAMLFASVVPWALIFFLVWLFVVRPLRKVCQTPRQYFAITGPGRWLPDTTGKAGPE